MKGRSIYLALVLGLAGCSSGSLYDWGRYGASVDSLATDREHVDLIKERDTLAREIEKTAADGKLVPPGKYAYVGYLCYLTNDKGGARKYFEAEKRAYPESTVFVDRLLGRMQ